jgi:3-dehydroquinate synthase
MTISSTPITVDKIVVAGKMISIDLSASKGVPSYDIVIGEYLLSQAGALIETRLGKRRCVIITDSHVGPLYCTRLEGILTASGHSLLPSITVAAGESSKDFTTLHNVLEQLLASGIDRKCLIVALGGGVVGDLAGVAASLALRGLDIVQIPTTLLAQVDSSVGGKTGIDTPFGKNTVGAFYQPRLVIADVALLDSLTPRDIRSGYAEVVKYGLLGDVDFFRWCQSNGDKLLTGDRTAQIYAVNASCAHKARIVAADEREAGDRALLNLGHTFGHALESALGYSDVLLHGEAVAIGMALAFRLSAQLGLCGKSEADEVDQHLRAVGLPVKPPHRGFSIDALMGLMAQDKKAEAGRLTLVLVKGIGKAFVSRDVALAAVEAVWQEALS